MKFFDKNIVITGEVELVGGCSALYKFGDKHLRRLQQEMFFLPQSQPQTVSK
jgi:hypothetical protein